MWRPIKPGTGPRLRHLGHPNLEHRRLGMDPRLAEVEYLVRPPGDDAEHHPIANPGPPLPDPTQDAAPATDQAALG